MNKEFIPYEQALALKELGFDEPCFGWWFVDEKMLIIEKSTKSISENIVQAPTFSQAFRFFRERYELGHMINGIGYESFIFNIGGLVYSFGPFQFKNYEEAELACLMKIIEIVEKNQ